MLLVLESRAKTVPSNYSVKGIELSLDIAPGESCTPEQWDKAERQESTYYDWESYMQCVRPKMEHPEYVRRAEEHQAFQDWEKVLNKLEPLPRLP